MYRVGTYVVEFHAPSFRKQMRRVVFTSLVMLALAVPVLAAPLSRAQEFARVDKSITASLVQSHPAKYVSKFVAFDCIVANVVTNRHIFANATCGDGNRANIVLVGDHVRQLHRGQSLTVVGQVIAPIKGTNMFGGAFAGSAAFATVRFDWSR